MLLLYIYLSFSAVFFILEHCWILFWKENEHLVNADSICCFCISVFQVPSSSDCHTGLVTVLLMSNSSTESNVYCLPSTPHHLMVPTNGHNLLIELSNSSEQLKKFLSIVHVTLTFWSIYLYNILQVFLFLMKTVCVYFIYLGKI